VSERYLKSSEGGFLCMVFNYAIFSVLCVLGAASRLFY